MSHGITQRHGVRYANRCCVMNHYAGNVVTMESSWLRKWLTILTPFDWADRSTMLTTCNRCAIHATQKSPARNQNNFNSAMRLAHTHMDAHENTHCWPEVDPVGGVFPHSDPRLTAGSFFFTPVQK